jgi:CubicO group peptidase (beta-lactamase class C family)
MTASNPRIRQTIQGLVDNGSISGAIFLTANREQVISLDAAGYADLGTRRPMTPDTFFWIASMTKPLTAACFMMLVEAGQIRLDDPVEQYLPAFKGQLLRTEQGELKVPQHPITIREILSHSAGLPFSSPLETPTLDIHPLRDTVASYAKENLLFEPGTRYFYSNEGINIAGHLIEIISGMPYEDFLQSRLLDPLTMNDSTFHPDEAQLARLALTYRPDENKQLIETKTGFLHYPLNDPHTKRHPFPGGGLFSSVTGLARFGQMLLSDGEYQGQRYLSADSIKQMRTRQSPATAAENYGLGCNLYDHACYGHGGALNTNLSIHPEENLVTIFLIQHEGWAPDDPVQSLNSTLTAIAKQK